MKTWGRGLFVLVQILCLMADPLLASVSTNVVSQSPVPVFICFQEQALAAPVVNSCHGLLRTRFISTLLRPPPLDDPTRIAQHILQAFDRSYGHFREITQRAEDRFKTKDWAGVTADDVDVIRSYRTRIDTLMLELQDLRVAGFQDPLLWENVRTCYLHAIQDRYEADLAVPFFQSIQRRVFPRLPIDYTDDDIRDGFPRRPAKDIFTPYRLRDGTISPRLVRTLLRRTGFESYFRDMGTDSELVAERLQRELMDHFDELVPETLEVLNPVFYRHTEAYLIARIRSGERCVPFVLALRHSKRKQIHVDAVLIGQNDLRDIFLSSTLAPLRVDTPFYRETLDFLETLAPEKGRAALAASIGLAQKAKVLLNKELRQTLQESDVRLDVPEGVPGSRMVVFNDPRLPRWHYVFKVVRNVLWERFHYGAVPVYLDKDEVLESYRLTNETDRLGRMLDPWMYRNFMMPMNALSETISQDLLTTAESSVRRTGTDIMLNPVYVMRTVVPLDVYLRRTQDVQARNRVLLDFFQCLKDLAAGGVFVSDAGLKNFGVTHGEKVVLYDYDSRRPLESLHFMQSLEENPKDDDENSAYWSTADHGPRQQLGDNDVILEWWTNWRQLPSEDLKLVQAHHGDIFTVEYWQHMQKQKREGVVPDLIPYPASKRLQWPTPEDDRARSNSLPFADFFTRVDRREETPIRLFSLMRLARAG